MIALTIAFSSSSNFTVNFAIVIFQDGAVDGAPSAAVVTVAGWHIYRALTGLYLIL